MLTLLLVGYYEVKESLLHAVQSLERLGYWVHSYPLYARANDPESAVPHFWEDASSEIDRVDPQVVLWWYVGIPERHLRWIVERHAHRCHALFNWDDPYMWEDADAQLERKCSCFDIALATCRETLPRYERNGVRRAAYALPGFSPLTHFPSKADPAYACDISFCCTNLYADARRYPDQCTNRAALLHLLADADGLDFRIYGPEALRADFPRHYRGYVRYADTQKVFASSRINLCTHVVGTARGYLCERVPLILGSGGLLLVDPVCGLDETLAPGRECIVLDLEDPVAQVRALLGRTHESLDAVRRAGQRAATARLQWRDWATIVDTEVRRFFDDASMRIHPPGPPGDFDWERYVRINRLDRGAVDTAQRAWKHWRTEGRRSGLLYTHRPRALTPSAAKSSSIASRRALTDGQVRVRYRLGRIRASADLDEVVRHMRKLQGALVAHPSIALRDELAHMIDTRDVAA